MYKSRGTHRHARALRAHAHMHIHICTYIQLYTNKDFKSWIKLSQFFLWNGTGHAPIPILGTRDVPRHANQDGKTMVK